ncbi:MJ0042 family finger-like protein [Parvibaculum lavamentivorans DS-1]|uniref:MJ0042 family finger-like protein n=1 Tax=Parvibaculum lavamentivorans (strain DS-1 / DSM 13023 / NCIMB 13966) TaxID=402881 RepID=A7HTI2_PARL1|nr:DUF3426 domain-containing protein [Parvibaculum lavamentivorans]ABS63215.1 MJ0042 family finger-like protein [Parvibaculum lavamentivorans DS-1]
MIITCPSCSSRYPVDAASFAPAGRKVRCAKCGHSWHQSPPSDIEAAATQRVDPQGAVEAPAPVVAALAGRKKIFGEKSAADTRAAGDVAAPRPAPEEDDIVFGDKVSDEKEPEAKSGRSVADIGNRFRAEVRRAATMRRGKTLTAAGWVVLALFVGATLGAGYFYRMEIAAAWPATTKVYAALGEPINLRGLEFRNVSYERQTEEGLPVLAVRGEVVNVSGERVALPRLRVALLDEKQQELYHWTFAIAETQLPPNEAAPFITRLSSPPPEARDIEVRFAEKTAPLPPEEAMLPAEEEAAPLDVPAEDGPDAAPAVDE